MITFNAASSPAAAQALLRNITFENVSESPSLDTRVVNAVLTDGDGGVSGSLSQEVVFGFAIGIGSSGSEWGHGVGES